MSTLPLESASTPSEYCVVIDVLPQVAARADVFPGWLSLTCRQPTMAR